MGKRTIFIVGQSREPNIDKVAERLARQGAAVFRLNTETFPLGIDGTWRLEADGVPRFEFVGPTGRLRSEDVDAVWYRRFAPPLVPEDFSPSARRFAENESVAFLEACFDELRCLWLNERHKERVACSKPHQLATARACGFRVPRTLISNNPADADAFARATDGPVIFKPVAGSSHSVLDLRRDASASVQMRATPAISGMAAEPNDGLVFAQILDAEKAKHLDQLGFCPVVFQEYIPKARELRVTVVGARVFACAIYSQEHSATKTDWRRMVTQPGSTPRHDAVALPQIVESSILKLMHTMGLEFGCLDLVETPDGELVFLEVNPAGQWGWVESLAGLPITEALVDLLMGAAH